ncbi:hypothetical protein [Rheinheimera sp. 1928-s]|uniref:hypothetical protein n=1 Tax=Rheinheimera sp. 1928-s TaxID=3033803 RepID=UPI0026139589|nr:hypothetical protein [Rheinheimera sp. 1928-s]MDF3127274.1 hypothetical protein [Rheinheimera sp. 1928-s]
MTFYHVIAKLESEESSRVLFSDLSKNDLNSQFITPYEKGVSFFSGNDLVSPTTLRSVQIILTAKSDEVERDEINRKDREKIDHLNSSDSGAFFVSVGGGYDPEDIAGAGDDVTHSFIKGPPGFKANRWSPSLKVVSWVGGIVAVVAAAGLVKWLGWA